MSALFRKLPIPVEARQVPPSEDGASGLDLAAWCGGSVSGTYDEPKIFVPTLEGDLVARVGDWIVKGPRGEFWPVKGDIFAETYEPVTEPAEDTFPAWLAQRFDPNSPPWDALDHDGRTYWQHEAAAVRRAVARRGFKNDTTGGTE